MFHLCGACFCAILVCLGGFATLPLARHLHCLLRGSRALDCRIRGLCLPSWPIEEALSEEWPAKIRFASCDLSCLCGDLQVPLSHGRPCSLHNARQLPTTRTSQCKCASRSVQSLAHIPLHNTIDITGISGKSTREASTEDPEGRRFRATCKHAPRSSPFSGPSQLFWGLTQSQRDSKQQALNTPSTRAAATALVARVMAEFPNRQCAKRD